MRSFEEWLRDTEIEPKYEERTPMEIAYEAGLREGIGDGSKVPCSDGLKCQEFLMAPYVICDCGHYLASGFNYLECLQATCKNHKKRFKMPSIKLEAF